MRWKSKFVYKCENKEPNHSEDILEVWHGTPQPLYLCGFHYEKRQAEKRVSA